jgi:LPXTG-motif cell wall-anchored protein
MDASPTFSDYLKGLGDIVNTGAAAYKTITNGSPSPSPQQQVQTAVKPVTSTGSGKSWLPWAIGGGVLVLVGVLFFAFRRK